MDIKPLQPIKSDPPKENGPTTPPPRIQLGAAPTRPDVRPTARLQPETPEPPIIDPPKVELPADEPVTAEATEPELELPGLIELPKPPVPTAAAAATDAAPAPPAAIQAELSSMKPAEPMPAPPDNSPMILTSADGSVTEGIVAPEPLPAVKEHHYKMAALIIFIVLLVGGGVAGAYMLLMKSSNETLTKREDSNTAASSQAATTDQNSDTSLTELPTAQTGTDTSTTPAAAPTDTALSQDEERRKDIIALYGQIESFYAQNGFYPSLTYLNNDEWRAQNFVEFDDQHMIDPEGEAASLASQPAAKVYSYEAGPKDCDNDSMFCAEYTLTATLSDSKSYTKKNLN